MITSLSLCRKIQLQDLQPSNMTIQMVDHSIKHPVDLLENVPILVDKFVIPCNFIVMDMDESSQVLIIGRPFITIVQAVIDVHVDTISFQLCVELAELCFPPPIAPFASSAPPVCAAHMGPIAPTNISRIKLVNGNGIPQRRFSVVFEPHPVSLVSFQRYFCSSFGGGGCMTIHYFNFSSSIPSASVCCLR